MGDLEATLQEELEVRPLVCFHTVYVVDTDTAFPEHGKDEAVGEIAWATVSALALTSLGTDFYPSLRIEVWNSEPLPPATDWDDVRDVAFTFPKGLLYVQNSIGRSYGPPGRVRLPAGPGPYRGRLCVSGRADAPVDEDIPMSPPDDPKESWLLQLWPTARFTPEGSAC